MGLLMLIADPERHPRLKLVVQPQWQALETDEPGTSEFAIDDRTRLVVRPIVALPAHYGKWIETSMATGLELDEPVLTEVVLEQATSTIGLPVVFAHYRIKDSLGRHVEERAGAFYRVLHVGAEVSVRLTGSEPKDQWKARQAVLKPILMAGEIEWPSIEPNLIYTLLGMKT